MLHFRLNQTKKAIVYFLVGIILLISSFGIIGQGRAYAEEDSRTIKEYAIKWRILSIEGEKALLLSDQCLACRQFHTSYVNVLWEDCSIRTWLNNDFYSTAFNSSERNLIIGTTIDGCENDKVFLLTKDDLQNADYGFDKYNRDSHNNRRTALASDAAIQEWYEHKNIVQSKENTVEYWTRSSGY